jgi:hypothetical protein
MVGLDLDTEKEAWFVFRNTDGHRPVEGHF